MGKISICVTMRKISVDLLVLYLSNNGKDINLCNNDLLVLYLSNNGKDINLCNNEKDIC